MPLKKVKLKSKNQAAADVLNTIRDPCADPAQCIHITNILSQSCETVPLKKIEGKKSDGDIVHCRRNLEDSLGKINLPNTYNLFLNGIKYNLCILGIVQGPLKTT
jgi:hypothetical protein